MQQVEGGYLQQVVVGYLQQVVVGYLQQVIVGQNMCCTLQTKWKIKKVYKTLASFVNGNIICK